jgi:hypothetical protein
MMEPGGARSDAKRNFILQQGLGEPASDKVDAQFSALQFQPRVVALVVFLGVILQSSILFLALSALLWWSALQPAKNPFDDLYNRSFGVQPGTVRLEPAPAPRRFAQGMAGSFALIIGALLLLDWRPAAYFFEALFLVAIIALLFGRFCLGSYIFHVVHGRASFARSTLPWARHPKDGAGP